MSCKIKGPYSVNGYVFPQPESTSWERVANGQKLSTNLPIFSVYRNHRWRFSALPDNPFTQRLEALEGTELTSLITDSPDQCDEFTEYDEAKILSVTKTHAWNNPHGLEVIFEVYAPRVS